MHRQRLLMQSTAAATTKAADARHKPTFLFQRPHVVGSINAAGESVGNHFSSCKHLNIAATGRKLSLDIGITHRDLEHGIHDFSRRDIRDWPLPFLSDTMSSSSLV